jgi:hypothetical protein
MATNACKIVVRINEVARQLGRSGPEWKYTITINNKYVVSRP